MRAIGRGARFCLAWTAVIATSAAAAPAGDLSAPPFIEGTATADYAGSALGTWRYTIEFTWDTGSKDLSHVDVLLDLASCGCVCELFSFGADETAGHSDGIDDDEEPCEAAYEADFECDGDHAIEGADGPLVRFDPIEEKHGHDECKPGAEGAGTLVFYSDWSPTVVADPADLLWMKYGKSTCSGPLTGSLPTCTCATSTEETSWADVKSLFR